MKMSWCCGEVYTAHAGLVLQQCLFGVSMVLYKLFLPNLNPLTLCLAREAGAAVVLCLYLWYLSSQPGGLARGGGSYKPGGGENSNSRKNSKGAGAGNGMKNGTSSTFLYYPEDHENDNGGKGNYAEDSADDRVTVVKHSSKNHQHCLDRYDGSESPASGSTMNRGENFRGFGRSQKRFGRVGSSSFKMQLQGSNDAHRNLAAGRCRSSHTLASSPPTSAAGQHRTTRRGSPGYHAVYSSTTSARAYNRSSSIGAAPKGRTSGNDRRRPSSRDDRVLFTDEQGRGRRLHDDVQQLVDEGGQNREEAQPLYHGQQTSFPQGGRFFGTSGARTSTYNLEEKNDDEKSDAPERTEVGGGSSCTSSRYGHVIHDEQKENCNYRGRSASASARNKITTNREDNRSRSRGTTILAPAYDEDRSSSLLPQDGEEILLTEESDHIGIARFDPNAMNQDFIEDDDDDDEDFLADPEAANQIQTRGRSGGIGRGGHQLLSRVRWDNSETTGQHSGIKNRHDHGVDRIHWDGQEMLSDVDDDDFTGSYDQHALSLFSPGGQQQRAHELNMQEHQNGGVLVQHAYKSYSGRRGGAPPGGLVASANNYSPRPHPLSNFGKIIHIAPVATCLWAAQMFCILGVKVYGPAGAVIGTAFQPWCPICTLFITSCIVRTERITVPKVVGILLGIIGATYMIFRSSDELSGFFFHRRPAIFVTPKSQKSTAAAASAATVASGTPALDHLVERGAVQLAAGLHEGGPHPKNIKKTTSIAFAVAPSSVASSPPAVTAHNVDAKMPAHDPSTTAKTTGSGVAAGAGAEKAALETVTEPGARKTSRAPPSAGMPELVEQGQEQPHNPDRKVAAGVELQKMPELEMNSRRQDVELQEQHVEQTLRKEGDQQMDELERELLSYMVDTKKMSSEQQHDQRGMKNKNAASVGQTSQKMSQDLQNGRRGSELALEDDNGAEQAARQEEVAGENEADGLSHRREGAAWRTSSEGTVPRGDDDPGYDTTAHLASSRPAGQKNLEDELLAERGEITGLHNDVMNEQQDLLSQQLKMNTNTNTNSKPYQAMNSLLQRRPMFTDKQKRKLVREFQNVLDNAKSSSSPVTNGGSSGSPDGSGSSSSEQSEMESFSTSSLLDNDNRKAASASRSLPEGSTTTSFLQVEEITNSNTFNNLRETEIDREAREKQKEKWLSLLQQLRAMKSAARRRDENKGFADRSFGGEEEDASFVQRNNPAGPDLILDATRRENPNSQQQQQQQDEHQQINVGTNNERVHLPDASPNPALGFDGGNGTAAVPDSPDELQVERTMGLEDISAKKPLQRLNRELTFTFEQRSALNNTFPAPEQQGTAPAAAATTTVMKQGPAATGRVARAGGEMLNIGGVNEDSPYQMDDKNLIAQEQQQNQKQDPQQQVLPTAVEIVQSKLAQKSSKAAKANKDVVLNKEKEEQKLLIRDKLKDQSDSTVPTTFLALLASSPPLVACGLFLLNDLGGAMYIVGSKSLLKHFTPLEITVYSYVCASVLSLAFAILVNDGHAPTLLHELCAAEKECMQHPWRLPSLWLVLWLVFVPGITCYAIQNWAVARVAASKVAFYSVLQTAASMLFTAGLIEAGFNPKDGETGKHLLQLPGEALYGLVPICFGLALIMVSDEPDSLSLKLKAIKN
ncbi:unnamed protein product [Amoebophrya sp. A120]|nr:unnamed protein product [Amoebophrya sp. A120]|eukprot:GSA120T00010935001.1